MKIVNLLLSAVMASTMIVQGAAFEARKSVTMAQSSATVI